MALHRELLGPAVWGLSSVATAPTSDVTTVLDPGLTCDLFPMRDVGPVDPSGSAARHCTHLVHRNDVRHLPHSAVGHP